VKSERQVGVAGSFRDLRVSKLARAVSAEVFELSKAFPRPDYRTMEESMENWDTTPLSRTIRLYERLLPFTFHFSPFTSSQLCPP
jgi:hypothetical protein